MRSIVFTLLLFLFIQPVFGEELLYLRDNLGRALGMPTGTVKTNLRRSLIELRQSMQEAEQTRAHRERAVAAA